MVLLTTTAVAELSVWMGDFGWVYLISSSLFLIATIYWDVTKSAPSSSSEAEDMKIFITQARVRTGPFYHGMVSFLDRKM